MAPGEEWALGRVPRTRRAVQARAPSWSCRGQAGQPATESSVRAGRPSHPPSCASPCGIRPGWLSVLLQLLFERLRMQVCHPVKDAPRLREPAAAAAAKLRWRRAFRRPARRRLGRLLMPAVSRLSANARPPTAHSGADRRLAAAMLPGAPAHLGHVVIDVSLPLGQPSEHILHTVILLTGYWSGKFERPGSRKQRH